MKKFLSAFLAILMVLTMVATSMVTVFAEEEAEEVHSILISNGEDIAADQTKDVKSHGWRNHNGHEFTMMELDGQKAAAITVKSNASSTTPRFHYYSDTTVDLTKFTYVEFDFYISDLAKMTDGFKPGIELSSAGLQDKAEVAGDVTGVEWKAGWNHVKVALADIKNATPGDAGDFNPTAWNFMRVLVGGTGTFKASESDPLILAIDNFGFSDGTETPAEKAEPLPTPVVTPTEVGIKEILVSNNAAEDFYNPAKPGWAIGGGGQAYGNGWAEVELDGKTGVATTLTGSGNVVTSRYHYYAVEAVDISGMTHLELDLYISDASIVNGKQFIIELQDLGLWGHIAESESRYLTNNAQFKDGWNHIKLSLETDIVKWEAPPALNKTAWSHIRVWFPDAAYDLGSNTVTYALGGLKFTNAAYDEQSISVPLVESTKPEGWNWAASLNIKKSGSAAISTTLVANKQYGGGAGAFLAAYNHEGTIDASAAETFRFWLYTDDAAVMKTVQVEMELTSGGTCDSEENAYVGSLDKFVEGGIQNGWNEVIIPLADINHVNGGVDWTRVNFFRMYNQQGFSTADVAMTIALDELAFYNAAGEVVAALSGCDIKTDWEGPTGPMTLDGEVVIGNTWEAGTTLGVGWFMFRYGLNVEGKYPEAVDISGMKYIEFDIYVSDAMALINAGFSFELTGEGIQDKNESAYNWDGWRTALDDGWNHVQWPLSWFNANTAGSCDFSAWNFLRMFNAKDVVVGENGLTVAIKNVEFTTGKYYALELDKDGQPLTEKEIISFTPVQSDKDNQDNLENVIKITSGANAEKFYADATGEVIYRVPVSGKKYVKYVTMSMTTGAQLKLEASTDGETWSTVYDYKYARLTQGLQQNGGLEKGLYTFDLTEAVVGEKGLTGDYIYIRITDSYPAAGWGGNLYYTPVTFEIIRTIAPHAIELPAYGTNLEGWNWSSSLNHAEGSFSASNTFKAGQTLGNANILVLFQSKDGEGVDASAADTFEFDLYVSNAAALKDMNVEMELTSGGRPDDHEKRYVNATLSALIEGGMKDGWNHVVLPLSKMGDHDANAPIDWTNVNCFRQYFFAGVNTGDADLVVAYDNLIFTKGGEKVATLSNAEPNTNGWEGPAMDMNGELVIGKEITGNAFGVCDIYINYIGEKGIDVSGLKYLEYDIYVSDVESLKNVTLFTEINSSGDYDKNELGYDKTFGDHGLKNGWNRIKIELAKMGDTAGNGACDLTDIKWFRIFTVAEATLTDGLTYAITNVRFTDDDAPEVALPENPTPDTPAGPPAADSELSVKDAIALGGSMEHNTYTEGKYYVTGVITEVYNEKYGNMKITDAEGNILTIYGTWSADGSTRYDALETKPVAGDTVTLYGIVGQYNGTPQIKNGWITAHTAAGDDPEPATKTDLYEFQIDNGAKEAPYLDPDYKANWNGSLRFADGSQYFIYKFKLTAFRGVESITFAGNFGGSYHIWASADGKNWIEIDKRTATSPAVSLELDLSELADDVANTMMLYVKIGDAVTTDGNGGNMNGNVQLKVVYDKDADQTEIIPTEKVEQEKISFRIETDEEKAYLIENDAPINETLRYADAGKHFTYKYTIKNVHQVKSVIWKAKTSQQLKLDISFDNENWVNVFSTTEKLSQQVREYDLTEFLVDENGTIANATFYLKISDADPADGWGGSVNRDADVTLLVDYVALTDEQKDAIEATKTEHCIPLWGANKTWGDIYVTDNDNQVAGSGCVSANLKGVQGTHAPSKQFESVDATGMDTFEFYVYLSDLAIVDHLKNNTGSGSVEICSGGSCDQGEKAVSLNQIFTDFVVGELATGWNEIAIPLDRMAGTPGTYGAFEINNINYIRIFWSGMTNPTDQDWIIKFDNFRMTDRQAEADRIAAEFEATVLEENKGLIANMEALKTVYEGELNADNFASAKAKYSNTKAAFEKLSAEAQEVLKAKGYYQHISKAKKAIEDYEEVQQILKDNAKLIADLEALAAYKDASAFTFDNYDAAKAAIEAARAAVDALTKTQKDALETYIAHLTAAEAALPAEKPVCTDHVDADKNGKCDKCDAEVPVESTDCEHVDADGDKKCDKCGEDMGGCKSALTIGALATMILAGAWVTIAARKKED